MADIAAIPGPMLPDGQEGKDGDLLYDAAGNSFASDSLFLVANSNDTWINVTKYDPNGSVLDIWAIRPPYTWKFDATPSLAHFNGTVFVRCWAHTFTPPNTGAVARRSRPFVGRIPGVFVEGSAPPPPPPPTGTDLVITAPAIVAGTWRRVGAATAKEWVDIHIPEIHEVEYEDGD